MQTVDDIRRLLEAADEESFAVLERALAADQRKGVARALEAARKRLASVAEERKRVDGLYRYQAELAQGGVVVGLDEVGRGPLAGPLTVAAVVLPETPQILGLNDSKQVAPAKREQVSQVIRQNAIAYAIVHAQPSEIDELGMSQALRNTFKKALAAIESQGIVPDVVLIDGNPLHLDPREINVVKGDGKCASIAAASIIAKVERDALMVAYAKDYPEYGFDLCKGYGSQSHMDAIRAHGLSPIHRRSFCHFYEQETLF